MSKKRIPPRPKLVTFEDRVQKTLEGYQRVNKKQNVAINLTIVFPNKKVPWLSRLASKVISKQGGVLDIRFIDLQDK